MNQTISKPRDDISEYAPKITSITIPVDRIRDVIGPGGKIIKGIQDESGATIEVEDDGTVRVIAVNTESAKIALERIRLITADPEVGEIYEGEVKSIHPFGAFVEILPNRDGLLHISEIAHRRLDKVEDELKIGDKVRVKVLEINGEGKVRLSRKVLIEKPEGSDRDDRPHRGDRDRDDRPRRGDRDRDRSRSGSRPRRGSRSSRD